MCFTIIVLREFYARRTFKEMSFLKYANTTTVYKPCKFLLDLWTQRRSQIVNGFHSAGIRPGFLDCPSVPKYRDPIKNKRTRTCNQHNFTVKLAPIIKS